MLLPVIFLIVGGLLLYLGAEGLVRGSVAIAFRMGISALVIGLTFVAFGTSSPELVVSISAGFWGNSEIALGNVIGSNICNIALILGAAAVIRPIEVDLTYLKNDIIIMLGVSILMTLLIYDGLISNLDGAILTLGIISYIVYSFYSAKKQKKKAEDIKDEIPKEHRPLYKDILFFVVGLIVLVIGARLFVNGAVTLAEMLGVSNTVIGISVVAFGTSLPELATSIVAALKNEADVSLGNVIGSNIFNILMILGFTGVLFTIPSGEVNFIDILIMLGVSIIIFPLALMGRKLSRLDGIFLLLIYFGYIYYLYTQEM